MSVQHRYLQSQLFDAEFIQGNIDEDEAAVLIAEKVILGNYDFMALRIHDQGHTRNKERPHSDIKMILELIKRTNCPVMSLTTRPVNHMFRNILQPVELNIDVIEWHTKILHFAKAFHSNIHLLLVCNSLDEDIFKHGKEVMQLSKEYFQSYDLKVNARIIQHFNISDTILAYASIIEADLIGNVTRGHHVKGKEQSGLTWKDLLCRSEIPLYNYIG